MVQAAEKKSADEPAKFGHEMYGFPWVWVSSLFNYNFNQYVAGRAIAYLASIPQSHHVARSYPGRNLHFQSFPPPI